MINIKQEVKILRTLKNYPELKIIMQNKLIEVSYGGLWWRDYNDLKKSVTEELRYKLRCRHSLSV